MHKAKAAIFIPNSEAAAHTAEIKQEIRNCGCTINSTAVYTDLKPLMADARMGKFNVLFLNYAHLRDNERIAAREAVNRLYTIGRSVIVC